MWSVSCLAYPLGPFCKDLACVLAGGPGELAQDLAAGAFPPDLLIERIKYSPKSEEKKYYIKKFKEKVLDERNLA